MDGVGLGVCRLKQLFILQGETRCIGKLTMKWWVTGSSHQRTGSLDALVAAWTDGKCAHTMAHKNNQKSLPLKMGMQWAIHTSNPWQDICAYSFSFHITSLFFFPIPGSFDSLKGDQKRPLQRNLISWFNAKMWLLENRTIAVVQWARNLTNTNMISSACPGSWQNAEIVWLLQQWKSLRWKIQHRVASLQLPLIWQIWT